jgi:hypothetical protein
LKILLRKGLIDVLELENARIELADLREVLERIGDSL